MQPISVILVALSGGLLFPVIGTLILTHLFETIPNHCGFECLGVTIIYGVFGNVAALVMVSVLMLAALLLLRASSAFLIVVFATLTLPAGWSLVVSSIAPGWTIIPVLFI